MSSVNHLPMAVGMLQRLTMQEAARQPRLPQELTDIVIDHLHDDKESLKACTLVSDDWFWPARFHLFNTTVITTSNEKHGLDAFLDSVATSPLQLGHQVRCLHVRGAHDKSQDDFLSILDFMKAILPRLPSIRKVTLSRMVWGQGALLPSEFTHPMPWELGMLSLKDIRLEASDAESLDVAQRHLAYLLQLFSSIRLLTIDTVRIGYRALYRTPFTVAPVVHPLLDPVIRGRCRISALNCFTEDDSFYLLAALSRLGFARNLQTLKFGSGCPEITTAAQIVTNFAASSLRFVRYRVPSDDYVASRMPVFDLSRCTSLHTAHLRGFVSSSLEARTVLTQMINTVTCTPPETQAVILEFFARPQDFDFLYDTPAKKGGRC
ncbi:hypothetical protein BXZ70DRAFT_1004782 [Cristinia sonorae]|uniref:F-box domain-containing protein n=1 Tax=Cristinia sonorae TaxID=1940300 RepID=A0A8K0UWI5_9AGAR|nr:hypothetical protein BXZ70DRAFT_1004782 [Cristinia sonorae]